MKLYKYILITLIILTSCSSPKEVTVEPPITSKIEQEESKEPTIDNIEIVEEASIKQISMPKSLSNIPAAYKKPIHASGTLEYFYYDTKYYDKDNSEMQKYALVYLPYGYDEYDYDTTYDVVYLMHGRDDSPEHFFGTPDKPSANKYMIDHLIKNGMKPMIIVACDYYPNNKQVFNGDGDASMTKNFGKEYIYDLMPQFESKYNTYAQNGSKEQLIKTRYHRIFAGFSMGAVTTWYRMADAMDYSAYFLPMSGTLYWGSEVYTEGKKASTFIPNYLEKAIIEQGYTKDDFVMIACVGTKDFALRTMNANIEYLKNKTNIFNFTDKNQFINSYYYIGQNDPHDYVAAGKYLYNTLPLFSEMIGE